LPALKILVAQDIAMFRGALVALIELEPDLKVVASIESGYDIVPAALASRPDIVIIDIDLPGVDGISAARKVIDPQLAMSMWYGGQNPLSPREHQVLRIAAEGSEPTEIAAALHLSVGTVRNYLTAIVLKLNARNRVDAIKNAYEAGWLPLTGCAPASGR
jgi:two-component system response regulator DesR